MKQQESLEIVLNERMEKRILCEDRMYSYLECIATV